MQIDLGVDAPLFITKTNGSLKGIFQPFELGGVTRVIRSAVKFCKAGHLNFFFFNDTIPREEIKTN